MMDETRAHEPGVVLSARGLRKEFFRKGRSSATYFDAVSSVDIDLRSGEVVVLMGRSGSGKSTLLNMLAGLLEPTEGSVVLEGRSLYDLDDASLSRLRNERIGVVAQGQTAIQSLSVIDNVLLGCMLYGNGDAHEQEALDLLDRMGVAHLADSFPSELSGGELRRMAIARALVCKPAVLLADEPTGDLDDENTELVLSLLRECADAGAAVFVVTHEAVAERFADKTYRMAAGALEACGR